VFEDVYLNIFGFYTLLDLPTEADLQKYYAEKYYQQPTASHSYALKYADEEIDYLINKIDQKYSIIHHKIDKKEGKRNFLDIGCGEGFALAYFKKQGWEVIGLDYSSYGCMQQNPNCLPDLIEGNIYANLDSLAEKDMKFSCIWLDNVLEHVLDPFELLLKCKKLSDKNTILVVEVPNDFSNVQQHLYKTKIISNNYWVVRPDHVSYFNKDGLKNLSIAAGWHCFDLISDYPIDLNLFNPLTNYIENRSVGKSCHNERIAIENHLHKLSVEKVNNLYRAMANLDLGRSITGFFSLIK